MMELLWVSEISDAIARDSSINPMLDLEPVIGVSGKGALTLLDTSNFLLSDLNKYSIAY